MIARKKIVPPVTPTIVQARPRQRLFRYALLLCAFLFTAWFSYDYGRTHTPADSDTLLAKSGKSDQHIAKLEQERDTLKQQVVELEQSVEQINRALQAAHARVYALQKADSSQHEVPAVLAVPEPKPEPPAKDPQPGDNTLKLENVRIVPSESANAFRISFSVMHNGDSSDRVLGTIWIAVNGFSDGEPRRLSFKRLSADQRSYVKMGFDQQQDVTEDVVLPEGFRPKNILIEAKPYGDKYTGTSVKLGWSTPG